MKVDKVEMKELIKALLQENLTVEVRYDDNKVSVEIKFDGEHIDYDSDSK